MVLQGIAALISAAWLQFGALLCLQLLWLHRSTTMAVTLQNMQQGQC
jgi:hypothetical protein